MIEETTRLETYLPLSYRTPKERDYIHFCIKDGRAHASGRFRLP